MKLKNYITIISSYFGLGNYPFDKCQYQDTDNLTQQTLELNNKIIADFERILQLQFVEKTASENVCFANYNSELQDDFKQVFTQKDIFNYFYAVVLSSEYQQSQLEENYPKNTNEFWNLVRIGEKLRVHNLKR